MYIIKAMVLTMHRTTTAKKDICPRQNTNSSISIMASVRHSGTGGPRRKWDTLELKNVLYLNFNHYISHGKLETYVSSSDVSVCKDISKWPRH